MLILEKIQKEVAEIKEKVATLEPAYGSEAWWEKEHREAKEDVKAGRYTTVSSKKELNSYLDSLKLQKK